MAALKITNKEAYAGISERLFDLLDTGQRVGILLPIHHCWSTDHDGKIDFSDFVVAIAVFSGKTTAVDRFFLLSSLAPHLAVAPACSAKVLFELCDGDGDRKVSRRELARVSCCPSSPLCH